MPLFRCRDCHRYTLQASCPTCGRGTAHPGPAKFSPEDRWGKYRRKLKLEERAKAAAPRGESP